MLKKLTDVELDRDVLYVMRMHRGKENAVDRWALCVRIFGPGADLPRSDNNTHDRLIRNAISRLRAHGHIICNLGDGGGFFTAETVEEYQSFREYYGRHAWPIMKTIGKMDKAAAEKWPNPLQPRML